ncbi:hypothetical protein IFM89_030217 [Coptis chinensis]|uniref:Uncharacterized protein n=1 Tax=Coptis chinensis TaxID=261450 RepID=A0A835HMZ8_9MAGN|nr:hypothetical protein IFM89_030217 [Coptis chinensis]
MDLAENDLSGTIPPYFGTISGMVLGQGEGTDGTNESELSAFYISMASRFIFEYLGVVYVLLFKKSWRRKASCDLNHHIIRFQFIPSNSSKGELEELLLVPSVLPDILVFEMVEET